jgi:N-acetylmuramoyl-L-alanine amidase
MLGQIKQLGKMIVITLLIAAGMPVSLSMAQSLQGTHTVVLDAGHGGNDRGVKISDKYYEKDFTLDIVSIIKKELEKSGNIRPHLTRSSDKDLSVSERIKIISSSRPAIYVGIHVNAGHSKDSSGYEIYFPGFPSVPAGQVNSQEILKDMAQNKYLNESIKFAQLIQRNIDSVFPRKSRGIRNAPLVIVEELTVPAVIVEIGFSTNHEDRKKLMDENVRRSLAHALSQSIREYF